MNEEIAIAGPAPEPSRVPPDPASIDTAPPAVDTNLHVVAGPADRVDYSLDPLAGTAGEFTEEQSTSPADLIAVMDEAGVAAGVVIASRFHGFDNRYAMHAVRSHPDRFIGVANVDATRPDAAAQVERLAAEPAIDGVRLWRGGRSTATWVVDEDLSAVWDVIEARELPANAQTTHATALPATRRLLESRPGLRLIINHVAHVDHHGGSHAYADLLALAEHRHVHVNVPATLADEVLTGDPDANRFWEVLVDSFGCARLMWSAFYPSRQDHPYWWSVDRVRELASRCGDDGERYLMGGTALRLYGRA